MIIGEYRLPLRESRDSKCSRFDVFEKCDRVLAESTMLSGRASSMKESLVKVNQFLARV